MRRGDQMRIRGAQDDYEKKLREEKEFAAILERLHYFDSVTVRKDQITGVKTYGRSATIGDWPDALGGFITFARYLLDFEERKDVKVTGEATCPYCRSLIAGQDVIVSCRECKTTHHQDCWEETGRCSIFGCRGRTEIILNP